MSAYIVTKEEIDVIVTGLIETGLVDYLGGPDDAGRLLRRDRADSWGDGTLAEVIDCYRYQSCELVLNDMGRFAR